MLEAIIAGGEDPEKLTQLARGRLKGKIPQLKQALQGRVREHHRFLLAEYLDEWDALDARIGRVESEIDAHILPFESAVTLWQTLPGIDRVTACSLVAEIGVDMNQFPTAQHLASWAALWAALCPGNHESAGKRCLCWFARILGFCGFHWLSSEGPYSFHYSATCSKTMHERSRMHCAPLDRGRPQASQ